MRLEAKKQAFLLRKQGWTLSDIQAELGTAKSTLSVWFRNLELAPDEQIAVLRGRAYSRFSAAQSKRNLRLAMTLRLFTEGKSEAMSLSEDSLFTAGVMLYWAEGAKTTERLKFTNSDPVMISMMMLWFRTFCLVPENKFRISLHVHSLLSRPDIESYWSRITNLPINQFHKTQIKKSSLGYRKNPLYNGTCTICVYDVRLFRKMLGWKAGILDKFGIDMRV